MARPPDADALNTTEAAVLGAVARAGRAHGFQLVPELRPGGPLGRIVAVKPAMIYALLHKLEQRGLLRGQTIAQLDRPDRHEVTLSDAGREVLRAWVRTPVTRMRDLRQVFLLKHALAPAVGLSRRALLRAQRDALGAVHPVAEPEDAVARYRAAMVEAALAWLETEGNRARSPHRT